MSGVAARTFIMSISCRQTKSHLDVAFIQPARYLHGSPFRPKSSDDVDIPEKKLSFSYTLSSGPGGQNVQKVATKVEVRFHVDSADWLSEQVKEKLSQQKKLTNDGYLVTTSELTRSRITNKLDAIRKLKSAVEEASQSDDKILSPEEEEMLRIYKIRHDRKRVESKRVKSLIKQSRKRDWNDF